MQLVTIQSKAAYDELCATGVLKCNPELAKWLCEDNFRTSYDWLVQQMKQRIGEPPQEIVYPIWAWYRLDGKPAKLDLRKKVFNNYCGEYYALTVEIPDEQVLLSDEENWHYVLNNWYLCESNDEDEYDKAYAYIESLPLEEKQKVKEVSWEKIFNIELFENDWRRQGYYVQATFWELRKEYVISARKFIGRKK